MRSPRGFTLVEVALALFILATALTVLLSLQSSSTRKAIDERQRIAATLMARQIMAAIEVHPDKVPEGEVTGSARDILSRFVPVENSAELPDLEATLLSEKWPIPIQSGDVLATSDVLRRLTLRVAWGDRAEDALSIVYFYPEP